MAKRRNPGRGALAKDPPLRGQARKDAQKKAVEAGTRPPPAAAPPKKTGNENKGAGRSRDRRSGNAKATAPTRPENLAIFNGMNPQDQKRYLRIRQKQGLEAANAFMTKVTGQTPTGPGGRARTPEEKAGQPAAPPPPAGPPNEPPPGTPFEQMTPQEQVGEIADVSGQIGLNMGEISAGYDPRTFQQNYDPVYSQEMERARKNIYEQFDRRNQRQFEQQRLGVQQQIAERGLDPASPAAQELMRQQNEREVLANQEAASAAESAADARQQQIYNQALGSTMAAGEIWNQYQAPVMAQYGTATGMDMARFQAEQDALRQQAEFKQRRWETKNTPRPGGGSGGGGGTPAPTLFDRWRAGQIEGGYPSSPPPNLGNEALVGGASGVGGAINQNINRPVK